MEERRDCGLGMRRGRECLACLLASCLSKNQKLPPQRELILNCRASLCLLSSHEPLFVSSCVRMIKGKSSSSRRGRKGPSYGIVIIHILRDYFVGRFNFHRPLFGIKWTPPVVPFRRAFSNEIIFHLFIPFHSQLVWPSALVLWSCSWCCPLNHIYN